MPLCVSQPGPALSVPPPSPSLPTAQARSLQPHISALSICLLYVGLLFFHTGHHHSVSRAPMITPRTPGVSGAPIIPLGLWGVSRTPIVLQRTLGVYRSPIIAPRTLKVSGAPIIPPGSRESFCIHGHPALHSAWAPCSLSSYVCVGRGGGVTFTCLPSSSRSTFSFSASLARTRATCRGPRRSASAAGTSTWMPRSAPMARAVRMVSCQEKGLDLASSPKGIPEPGPSPSSLRPRTQGLGTLSPGSGHLALGRPTADSDDLFDQLLLLEPHGLLHCDLTEGVHGVLHAICDYAHLVRLDPDLPARKGRGGVKGNRQGGKRGTPPTERGRALSRVPQLWRHSRGEFQVGRGSSSHGLIQTFVEHQGHLTGSSDSVAQLGPERTFLKFLFPIIQCEIHFMIHLSISQMHNIYLYININITAM